MRTFWVSIEVHLQSRLSLTDEEGEGERAQLAGFVQELGCTADDESAMKELIREHVARYDLGPRQQTEVVFQNIEPLEPSEVEKDEELSKKLQAPVGARGVWFETARSFYSED